MNRRPPGLKLSKAISGFIQHKTAAGLAPTTIQGYERDLKKWETHIGDVTTQDVRDYLAWLRTEYKPHRWKKSDDPLSPKTLRNTWVTLSAFFRWASIELDVPNPMKTVPAPHFEEAPVEPFTQQDIEALLKVCEFCKEAKTTERRRFRMRRVTANRDRAIILFLLDTGLRASEHLAEVSQEQRDWMTTHYMGQGFHALLMPTHEFYGHDTSVMLRLLDAPNSWWIKQAGGREAVIARILRQTIEWLRAQLGPDASNWQWGRLHHASFPHPMGIQKPLDRVLSRGPLPIGGDTDTPCQTAIAPGDPYDNKAWAPTFRQIVDMGALSRSLVIIPPGQSGQLGSSHYDDLADLWLKGEYIPMLWTREQTEGAAEGRLILGS